MREYHGTNSRAGMTRCSVIFINGEANVSKANADLGTLSRYQISGDANTVGLFIKLRLEDVSELLKPEVKRAIETAIQNAYVRRRSGEMDDHLELRDAVGNVIRLGKTAGEDWSIAIHLSPQKGLNGDVIYRFDLRNLGRIDAKMTASQRSLGTTRNL